MGQVNCRKHYLSLRKSLVLYVIAFVVLAVFLSVTTFSICGGATESIRASYPPSGEKYYLTNEQGEQLGDGAYIGTVPVPMSKEDERTIALLDKLPIVATPIYSAFCIILLAYFLDMTDQEIADKLDMVRYTVQRRRAKSLKELKKEMEVDSSGEQTG